MMVLRIKGTYTALVTPLRDAPGQPIDWDAFDALVERQIAGGVSGIVPCGTTGESPTLSHEEHAEVIERAVKRAAGRIQVIAGTGSNSTREAIAMSQHAERCGADGVMVVVPYYNRPTQDGLLNHFREVAGSIRIPVVVYNIPMRTGVDLALETLQRIAESASNVIAIKEATGNVLRGQKIAQTMGARMLVLSGDDVLTLALVAAGASGVISVTSNLLPAETSRATKLALDGHWHQARRAHLDLLPVHESMFLEANPAPIKAALALGGFSTDVVRSPLVRCSDATRAAIARALETYSQGQG